MVLFTIIPYNEYLGIYSKCPKILQSIRQALKFTVYKELFKNSKKQENIADKTFIHSI
jgi:hypothetical protein